MENNQYDRLELEKYSGEAIKPQNVMKRWNQFVGENQTKLRGVEIITSGDGTRSIRFGKHEVQQINTTNFHYHEEMWYLGYVLNVVRRMQMR